MCQSNTEASLVDVGLVLAAAVEAACYGTRAERDVPQVADRVLTAQAKHRTEYGEQLDVLLLRLEDAKIAQKVRLRLGKCFALL